MIHRTVDTPSDFLTGRPYELGVNARANAPMVEPAATLPAWQSAPIRIRPVFRKPVSLALRHLERGEPFVRAEGHSSRTYHVSKRIFDVVGAAALIVLLSPLLLAVYLTLMVTTRGKPFFTQQRLGYRGKPFRMWKFRTMTLDAEARRGEIENEKDGPIFKNRHDARITRLGRILRTTSLDETPQLFNILLGHMSLVGPRPPIGEEVAEYEPWQRRRLSVKPGLTCLWQVSGRSEIDFEDWMRMDLWYVRHQCWSVDLKYLVQTPWTVLTGRGAY